MRSRENLSSHDVVRSAIVVSEATQQAAISPAPAPAAPAAVNLHPSGPSAVVAPRVVSVPASRFHSIVGAMTVSELLQELLEALAEGAGGGGGGDSGGGSGGGAGGELPAVDSLGGSSCAAGAVALPAHVVEVALAKTAGWALDAGARAGTDPETVRQTLEMLQDSLIRSCLHGYSLDDVASVLWSLASTLGEYGWSSTAGTMDVVQSWLGSSGTVEALAVGQEAGRFSSLASLLWGYAALLLRAGEGGVEAAAAATAAEVAAAAGGGGGSEVAGPGLDALALRAAELIRAYGSSEPVAAVEMADVAWALSIIGRRSPAVAQLAEAVAHEVYRQLSNRSSLHAPFEAGELVKVVRAYADMRLAGADGSVPRMLDAVGGHVAKRIRGRHVGAITRPADCAELLRGFADSGHNSVVVPELLRAVALQAGAGAAAGWAGGGCVAHRWGWISCLLGGQICREVAAHNEASPRPMGHDLLLQVGDSPVSTPTAATSTRGSSPSASSPSTSGARGTSTSITNSSSSVADRFRQKHISLWERRLSHLQQLSPEQRHQLEAEEARQAYWHWSAFLSGSQVISVLQSYIRMGAHYPGVDLTDSLLLAVRPQLPFMSPGEVSELLQLLAAVRHVPGPQTLDLLAAAALRQPHDAGEVPSGLSSWEGRGPPPPGCASPRPGAPSVPAVSGRAARSPLELQRLGSLWALVMMGWRPQAEELERVLAPVLLDDSLGPLALQDAGRLMSLLAVLPREQLTIQRFGLAAMKLREALAGPSAAAASKRSGDGGGWSRAWSGSTAAGEGEAQRQLRFTLLAAGASMALLGGEGWEMAEQVLPPAHFRLVEQELRRALREPQQSVDASCVAETVQALNDAGYAAAVTTLTLPVDVLIRHPPKDLHQHQHQHQHEQQETTTMMTEIQEDQDGDGDGDEGACPLDDVIPPLVFQPIVGRLTLASTASAGALPVRHVQGEGGAAAGGCGGATTGGGAAQGSCGGGAGEEGRGRSALLPSLEGEEEEEEEEGNALIVLLHVCSAEECASNTSDDSLVWGWARVRQALYSACCAAAAVVELSEGKLRKVKGRRDDARAYVQRALSQALAMKRGGVC
ncbi:hypothetical protein PLESTB_000887000 [Pleodorina starrii]|uniref:Uncharacterized protein n=1 Tax=Pleodorina starrii TaxID=330485 RepID=A0A9W6BM46_9CHLO|nr:hypothetical protein PLESTB_000803900 [Pleodorina starrii]GLC54609.1 hypothetical protein PLESTB_000887000 [Pleodorina starrii]GLC75394.1 hypothetical protein PLESTF_001632100 [Pleodorina starrii]